MKPASAQATPPLDELAHHEAGHAVVSCVLGYVPETVTIIAEGNAAGWSGSSTGFRAPGVLDQMVVSYAGYAAHVKYAPWAEERARNGSRADFDCAKQCMRSLHLSPGEPEALEKHQRDRAAKLVEEHWSAIQHVAQELLRKNTIREDELRRLVPSS